MSLYDQHHTLQNLSLGKKTAYKDQYDPDLLQPVPRSLNREPLNIWPDALPFQGEDIWTLYELSWLNSNGLPQVAIGEVTIRANSLNLIESKSFKLYLNSFNQTKFTSIDQVKETLLRDLAQCAQGNIDVALFQLSETEGKPIGTMSGSCIDNQDITIDDYTFSHHYLALSTSNEIVEETLVSHLLKSNCLVTHQPDWGSVQIRYRGNQINQEALLRYLVSFRHHNEFHEQCVERIFTDIMHFCQPQELTVYARYTRRGGLDINPWRSNVSFDAPRLRLARQ